MFTDTVGFIVRECSKAYMDNVRERKGLFVDRRMVEFAEKQRTLKRRSCVHLQNAEHRAATIMQSISMQFGRHSGRVQLSCERQRGSGCEATNVRAMQRQRSRKSQYVAIRKESPK